MDRVAVLLFGKPSWQLTPGTQARAIIKEVASVTATWRDTARAVGARPAEINRMASAFEHNDVTRALAL